MLLIQLIKSTSFFVCFLLAVAPCAVADTIYQWTDPWGQVQYSKKTVPGSMITDLTELPENQETTEQQKQDAMLKKLQEMEKSRLLREKKMSTEKLLKQQNGTKENYCAQLRNRLSDVQMRIATKYNLGPYFPPGGYFLPGDPTYNPVYHDEFLERDLYLEIRKNCR